MNRLKSFFDNKKIIYGTGSVVYIAVFIAIVVFINSIAGILVNRFPALKYDVTKAKMYELSDEMINVVKDIDNKITMFYLTDDVSNTDIITEVLKRMQGVNSNLKLELVNLDKNPNFGNKYNSSTAQVSYGSVIFENEDGRFQIIAVDSLVGAFDNEDGQKSSYYLTAESKFASALTSLDRDRAYNAVFTTGHGEAEMEYLMNALADEGFICKTSNIGTDGISGETDLLVVSAPRNDFSKEEIAKIDEYLKTGKAMQVYMFYQSPELERFENYIAEWGIRAGREVVIEGDSSAVLGNEKTYVIPQLADHTITKNIKESDLYTLMPVSVSLDILFENEGRYTVTPIQKSSSKSYTKNPDSVATGYAKDDNDKSGPFVLSALSTYSLNNEKKGSLFVFGSAYGAFEQSAFERNRDLLMNCSKWMMSSDAKLNITPKVIVSETLEINGFITSLWGIIVVGLIPLLIIIFGIFVWLKRKNL